MNEERESFIDMYRRLARQLQVPQADLDAVIQFHRKNLEALERAAGASATGSSEVLEKQREIFEQILKDITKSAEELKVPATPQDFMSRQVDFVRRSFEQTIENTSALTDLMKRSGDETLQILKDRIREGMNEIGRSYEQRK